MSAGSRKKELRSQLLRRRAALGREEKSQIDASAAEAVLQSEAYRSAAVLFIYVSTPEEIDTKTIILNALSAEKTVCVPLCGARGQMTARKITSLDELRPGAYGIWEPDEQTPCVRPEEIHLAIIPALACDRMGFRLGYGGGYYDRYLAQCPAVRAALCAEKNLLDKLPVEEHDLPCDYIFTERRVVRADEKP